MCNEQWTDGGKNDIMLRKLIVNWTLGVESFNIRARNRERERKQWKKNMVIISELILMRNNAAVTQPVDSPAHIYSRKEKTWMPFLLCRISKKIRWVRVHRLYKSHQGEDEAKEEKRNVPTENFPRNEWKWKWLRIVCTVEVVTGVSLGKHLN